MQYKDPDTRSAVRCVVCFAGSRKGRIGKNECRNLVSSFFRLGFDFLVGCASGIDQCFRRTLSELMQPVRWRVHCAFPSKAQAFKNKGFQASCTVADAPSAAAALHRRTVTMVSACTLLVLFPDDPATGAWGRGSRLAFNTAVQQHKPVFVVTKSPPLHTKQLQVTAGSLSGVVSGYWVTPLGVPVKEEVVYAQ